MTGGGELIMLSVAGEPAELYELAEWLKQYSDLAGKVAAPADGAKPGQMGRRSMP